MVYGVFSQPDPWNETLEGLFHDKDKALEYIIELKSDEMKEYGSVMSDFEVRKLHIT